MIMMRRYKLLAALLVMAAAVAVAACKGDKNKVSDADVAPSVDYAAARTPDFNADSAYRFVKEQLEFGVRTPGSKGHNQCREYLERQMRRFCDTVMLQDFNTSLWDGTQARGTNIIASLNLACRDRILLAAHWDSRLWADHDKDDANHKTPILGANDGASGVALLMEMARVMSHMPPSIGIDFIFFDLEDQGIPEWANTYKDDTWCLGSQYWAQNKHVPFYCAVYGVLFDMVGTREPRFTKEGFSRQYASGVTDKLWKTAAALGYGKVFVDMPTDPILDDHMYVNRQGGVPMVDIVQNSIATSFFEHWHTMGDDLSSVDANTLKLVAEVVMKTIYGDYGAK